MAFAPAALLSSLGAVLVAIATSPSTPTPARDGAEAGTGADASAEAEPGVPEDFVAPQVQNEITIRYPDALAEREVPPQGTVVVRLVVGVDGVPHSLEIEQGVDPEIDALVLEAVAQLRYTPATLRGEPVEVRLHVPVEVRAPARTPATEPAGPAPDVEASAPSDDAPDDASGPVRISGQIVEAGQRTPIGGATVVAVPAPDDASVGVVKKRDYRPEEEPAWQLQTYADGDGRFALRDVPPGKVRIVVLAPGYERLESIESLPPDQTLAVRYFLTREPDNPYRTVVKTSRTEREEVSRRTIGVEEIDNLPGTQGDALKAVQNFPGISRAPFGIGLLVIRGADPTDSAVYLGEHEIPQLFHFGGLTSVFNADILTQIDYIPGNFDARYGDAIGGIIDVKTRPGRRDGYHGYIDSDLFDTGTLLEGPIGKGSFILSARRSYIDLLLPAVLPDDAGIDLAVAPRYWDYQALFDYPVMKGNLSVKVFGSDDRTRLVAADPNDIETDQRNRFETTLMFHRVDVLYENRRGPWDFLITPSYRYDLAQAGVGDVFRFELETHTFSGRAEVGRRVAPRLRWDVGAQLFAGSFSIDAQAPPVPAAGAGSSGTVLRTDTGDTFAAPSIYGTLSAGLTDRFTLYPGVRVTAYGMVFGDVMVDPRLRASWQVGDRTTIKGGVGLYSQIPDPFEWHRVWGNPDIRPEQALQTSAAVAHEFPHDITVEVSGFYKYLWDLAAPSPTLVIRDGAIVPENFTNSGEGRIYGGEIFVRKDLTRAFFGWLSYTLSRSERRTNPDEPWILFGLDQTHILTLIGVYRLPRNWQIGARFRLVSGNPYTPNGRGPFDAEDGGYLPLMGAINSKRMPMFHQLDLRVDKRFVWKRVMLTTYLDVQNAYNAQNAEFMADAYDFSTRQPITSLPIIPSIGMKLEF